MNTREIPRAIRLERPAETETLRLATVFAAQAEPGMTLLLEGPIGAGKTTFARALIQHLQSQSGTAEDVPSPTFTLVQTYVAGALEIWHADLYRLTAPEDVLDLGLDAAFHEALCLVEWPDRLGSLAPSNAVTLSFGLAKDGMGRTCEVTKAELFPELLAQLQQCDTL